MLRIGDFSKLSRISIQMLRHYDKISLLVPAFTDADSGYRYYYESQLPIANQIRAMKEMGLGLSEIKALIKSDDQYVIEKLEQHRTNLHKELDILKAKLMMTENRISIMKNNPDAVQYHVSLKEIPGMTVMRNRGVLQRYEQEGDLWLELFENIARQKVKPAVPALHIAVYHDESYMENNMDVEVQCAVEGQPSERDGFLFWREPVLAATTTYQGDYSQLADVNAAIANWITENNYTFCGHGFNIYHVSPGDTSNTKEMVTEVCFPVSNAKEAE